LHPALRRGKRSSNLRLFRVSGHNGRISGDESDNQPKADRTVTVQYGCRKADWLVSHLLTTDG